MVAVRHDIILRQGASFSLPVACYVQNVETQQLEIRNLTGWSGAMQVRQTAESTMVLAQAVVTIDVLTGIVTASFDDATTAGYTWRTGVYDLIITNGVDTDWLVEGRATLRRSITRS